MTADLVYLVAGGSLLLAVVLPDLLRRWAISAPMVLVGVGMLIGATSLPDGLPLDVEDNRVAIEHLTELTVLLALTGVGLALDRPLQPLRRDSLRSWAPTWRLLAITMPLTIATVALLGWWAGLAPAAAVLLGAALAPTDPVLTSDVQVAGPQTGKHEVEETDEVRFTLTSEAGLNDGLAFPFVYAAILLATEGALSGWALDWVGYYLVAKIAIGVVAGIVVGRVLARIAFRSPKRSHEYHRAMHEVVERLERLFTLIVLLMLGIALTRGLLASLDWRGVAIALGLILVVRPIAGYVALAPWAAPPGDTGGLTPAERVVAAFFGVRGVGSLYYLAFALGQAELADDAWLWSTVGFTVVASVLIHGVLSTPVMTRLDKAESRS